MKTIKNNAPALLLFTLILYLILLIYPLTQRGMFLDGVVYAAVAKNLALGLGSVWHPFYSDTQFTEFYEHPVLAMYLQSFLFKIFGKGFLVERIYCLLAAVGQICLVSFLWSKSTQEKKHAISYLLLCLFWIITPLNTSTFKNNMLEMTATFFSTLAVCFLILNSQKTIKKIMTLAASGLCIFLGVLANGPTSIFVFSVPLIQTIIFKNQTYFKALRQTFILISFTLVSALLVFKIFPATQYNLNQYFHHQFMASITGNKGTLYTGLSHLYVFDLLFKAYWPIVLLSFILIALCHQSDGIKPILRKCINNKNAQFYFLIAMCASLPVGISPRQSFHYITQSSPFFLLASMFFLSPISKTFIKKLTVSHKHHLKIFTTSLCIFLFSFIFVGINFGNYNKHEAMIKDIDTLTQYFPPHTIFDVTAPIYNTWDFSAYLSRQGISSASQSRDHNYLITLKNDAKPKYYKPVAIKLVKYNLWQKNNDTAQDQKETQRKSNPAISK